MIYEKNNEYVQVQDKFVYYESVYKIFKRRSELIQEQYYSSDKCIKLKKKNIVLKRKEYVIYRFLDLIAAPLEYLLNNNFKKV
jgi:hypothetical protein